MHSVYLCPLNNGSQFCLSMACTQNNCNATDSNDAMTSEDVTSFPISYAPPSSQQTQVIVQSSSKSGSGTRTGDESGTQPKHVGFATSPDSQARSKKVHQRRSHCLTGSSSFSVSIGGSGGNSGQHCLSNNRTIELMESGCSKPCSLLVPLTSNQSNLHFLPNKPKKNAQETPNPASEEKSGCFVDKCKGDKSDRELMAVSGVRYWNVYEHQDFRQVQHGQGHVFDPQTDPNLHREGIILDNYNRLLQSYSRFRMPVAVYHVR